MIIIIPCGAKKRKGEWPAYWLYSGPYFSSCLRYALSIAPKERIFILSAKYGLLELETKVTSYDLKMGQPGSVTGSQVHDQALGKGLLGEKVICLGGKLYTDICSQVWDDIILPLSGIGGIGSQMAWLKKNKGRVPNE